MLSSPFKACLYRKTAEKQDRGVQKTLFVRSETEEWTGVMQFRT